MRDAQKPDHVSLTSLINRLRDGSYVIPDFQREFEWNPGDILALMRSIFLDYYIGSLLLWKGKAENFKALACEPIYGHVGNRNQSTIVLDGQQRLTAMYYTFCAPDVRLPNRANRYLYFIHVDRFMDESYDTAFYYDWTRRGLNLLKNKEAQFQRHIFPLAVVGEGGWALPNWVQEYERYWHQEAIDAREEGDIAEADNAQHHAENAGTFGKHLKEITEEYQVALIELDQDIEIDKVCDIFTQINSRGRRLDIFDLMNALLKPKELQLKHMWRIAEPRLDFVETDRMNVYILQIMSILRQNYCSPKYLYYLLPGQERTVREPDGSLKKEILVPNITDFEQRWEQAVEALEDAIELLRSPQEFGAISSKYLPYVSILPVFAALQAYSRQLPPNQRLNTKRKIRHWYWASVFTNRYSGSVESTSASDFIAVKNWFKNNDAEPDMIAEFRLRFRELDLNRETKRGTSIYNGIFNLLVLRGARDWSTGNAPRPDDLDDHHIVPKSWGKRVGLSNRIDTILNRTPLTSETNREVIRDNLPNSYLPELIDASGEDTVRAILESHFISPAAFDILLRQPFEEEDFEAFISERQRTLKDAIEDLLVKERLDLAPKLRELDAKIESVELDLRQTIIKNLNGNVSQLPSHILQSAKSRLLSAVKKNPELDEDYYQRLPGILEYCDLRELQATLTNKAIWPIFQECFKNNKEMVDRRFDQLCELRNGIRHSRTVTEVTQKEGEAAIVWFEHILMTQTE